MATGKTIAVTRWTFVGKVRSLLFNTLSRFVIAFLPSERLLLNEKTPGFLASRGEEFNLGPDMRLDHLELLYNKVLLKYKGDRESF